jgi:hypothetical protein
VGPFGPGMRMVNQRLAVRYELRARVEFCWIDDQGISRHGVGRTRDVSTRGAYVLGSAWPPKGTPVAMNIEIPFSPATARVLRVQTEGRVVRVDRPGSDGSDAGFSVQNDRVTSFQG